MPVAVRIDARAIDARVAAVLPREFARFLAADGCDGTGPDDCILTLHLRASLAPDDPALAAAIATLEPNARLGQSAGRALFF